jgi:hypothetical protein
MKRRVILHVQLSLDASNDAIVEQMRIMKRGRENGFYTNVVCTIGGFGDDPRELYQIPEARAFCRRLVTIGFISYLDGTTTMFDNPLGEGWGAAEVWLASENKFAEEIPASLLGDIETAILVANEKCDALLGPYVHPEME